jgi:hypothetical protein
LHFFQILSENESFWYFNVVQTLTEYIFNSASADRILDQQQLDRLVGGSDQRRYALVNRALKAGELIRLRRGLYVLADRFRRAPVHPYALAQRIEPGSYVSLESALSWHGWIPEAVQTITSILPGRKRREYRHERFGVFTYRPLAIQRGAFLEQVRREQADGQSFLLAGPMRALMDLVCLRKIEWQGMSWIEHGLRIDREVRREVTGAELRALKTVYRHQRVQRFLNELEIALSLELSHE